MSEYCYKYPRPALTVDILIFAVENNSLQVLLIQREREPYKDSWALPGGFVDPDETAEEAASRELLEETGLKTDRLQQLAVMSDPERDPRGRVVSVVFWTIITEKPAPTAGDDAKNARWFPLNQLPPLAFDHDEILKIALKRLKNALHCNQKELLPIANNLTINSIKQILDS